MIYITFMLVLMEGEFNTSTTPVNWTLHLLTQCIMLFKTAPHNMTMHMLHCFDLISAKCALPLLKEFQCARWLQSYGVSFLFIKRKKITADIRVFLKSHDMKQYMHNAVLPVYEAFQSAFRWCCHAGTLGSCSETEKNKSTSIYSLTPTDWIKSTTYPAVWCVCVLL